MAADRNGGGATALGYSPGIYNWLKAIHILAAIVWVGGGAFAQIYATRLMRANEMPRAAAFAKDIERIGLTIFTPASIVVLILGVARVWYPPPGS